MNTLPLAPSPLGSPTSSVEPPVMLTGPKFVTVRAAVLCGSTGTSPVPATLAIWIVPPCAESAAPVAEAAVIEIGAGGQP